MESLNPLLEVFDSQVLQVLAGVLVGWLVGMLVGRMGTGAYRREAEGLAAQVTRAESQTKEQSRIVARMRSEQGTVASLALSLPSVVRELNRADFDNRRVPGLIMQLADSIFQPGQMLFYQACESENGGQELRLISHHGLNEVPRELRRIAFGRGKIGWIAVHKLEMLREGWTQLTRSDGISVEDNHPILDCDIIGPLVHTHIDHDQVLGVLCIGSPAVRPRDEKLMFQLVTNLGSLALVNSEYRKRLRAQANHDGLTGLLNKRYFLSRLAEIVVKAEKQAQPVSLFLFDIDHFKTYNDTNGHPAGDDLLRALSGLLQESIRPGDLCARYGGEEFILAMPNTDANTALGVAERIREAIELYPFDLQRSQPGGKITISGGVSAFPKDGADISELTEHADQALYESKRGGRNRVRRFRGVHIGQVDDDYDRETAGSGSGSLP